MENIAPKTLILTDKEIALVISAVEQYQTRTANLCKKKGDLNARRYDLLEGIRTKLFNL